MKTPSYLLAGLLSVGVVPMVSAGGVKQDPNVLIQEVRDYTTDQRKEYEEKIEARLAAFEERIAGLLVEAGQPGMTVEPQLQELLDRVRQRKVAAEEKLEELKIPITASWEEMKAEMEAAMAALERAYARARSYLQSVSRR